MVELRWLKKFSGHYNEIVDETLQYRQVVERVVEKSYGDVVEGAWSEWKDVETYTEYAKIEEVE